MIGDLLGAQECREWAERIIASDRSAEEVLRLLRLKMFELLMRARRECGAEFAERAEEWMRREGWLTENNAEH